MNPAATKRRFDPLAYRDPAPRSVLIRALGPLNRHVLLRRLLRLARFELPAADLARLRAAVHPGTAAFLGPNHPEFMTDWLIDKEVSRLSSPLMAHWASYEIVNGSPFTQRFWLANNLIANAPGGGGKAYSVRWALAGHGVLLHPEGTATWQADRVGPLLPGIVDMAWEAAGEVREQGASRPVFVVPLVWKLHFTSDVSAGLTREMTHVERQLGLPRGSGPVEERFAALVAALLERQCARLDLPAPGASSRGAGYFAAQRATLAAIRERLEAAHGALESEPARAQHQLRKAIRARAASDPDGARRDRGLLAEMQRLTSFDPALYDAPSLTQEHMAETLKRTRTALVTRGMRQRDPQRAAGRGGSRASLTFACPSRSTLAQRARGPRTRRLPGRNCSACFAPGSRRALMVCGPRSLPRWTATAGGIPSTPAVSSRAAVSAARAPRPPPALASAPDSSAGPSVRC